MIYVFYQLRHDGDEWIYRVMHTSTANWTAVGYLGHSADVIIGLPTEGKPVWIKDRYNHQRLEKGFANYALALTEYIKAVLERTERLVIPLIG